MAVIAEPDVAVTRIKNILSADATLLALTVTINGTARVLQGVFYHRIPQDVTFPYPAVQIGTPIQARIAQRMHPNGPHISQASFLLDVWAIARDVEPDDAGLQAIRARVIALIPTMSSGSVTGGQTNGCQVDTFPPAIREDRGSYIFSKIGVTLRVNAQVT